MSESDIINNLINLIFILIFTQGDSNEIKFFSVCTRNTEYSLFYNFIKYTLNNSKSL